MGDSQSIVADPLQGAVFSRPRPGYFRLFGNRRGRPSINPATVGYSFIRCIFGCNDLYYALARTIYAVLDAAGALRGDILPHDALQNSRGVRESLFPKVEGDGAGFYWLSYDCVVTTASHYVLFSVQQVPSESRLQRPEWRACF